MKTRINTFKYGFITVLVLFLASWGDSLSNPDEPPAKPEFDFSRGDRFFERTQRIKWYPADGRSQN